MFCLTKGLVRFGSSCPANARRLAIGNVPLTLFHWASCISLAALITSGCGTAHATLEFTAPANVTAGAPFTVTVTVLYEGRPDTVINSHIHFTSSDPAAILPSDYYFTPSDAGSHTWTNAFVLVTPGNQTISADILPGSKGINGTTKIIVSP